MARLYGRTSLRRKRNNRHVSVPVLHGKTASKIKGTVVNVQICWLTFLHMEILS